MSILTELKKVNAKTGPRRYDLPNAAWVDVTECLAHNAAGDPPYLTYLQIARAVKAEHDLQGSVKIIALRISERDQS